MSKTMVFIITDDAEVAAKAQSSLASLDVTVTAYGSHQWKEGLENNFFRTQLSAGLPSLSFGSSPIENHGNVLPFPGVQNNPPMQDQQHVSTMNELESQAIENAILQFRGNLTEAAKALGIGRATLYRKVKQYQIDPSVARKRRTAA